VFPYDGRTYEALLAGADQAMYRDKGARRGTVAVPSAPVSCEFAADMRGDAPPPIPSLDPQFSTP